MFVAIFVNQTQNTKGIGFFYFQVRIVSKPTIVEGGD